MRPAHTTHLHFIGIGGDGMSGLAKVYSELGFRITGCNLEENRRTQHLRALGIPVEIGHSSAHLQRATHVIVSSAIPPDNIELLEAQRVGPADPPPSRTPWGLDDETLYCWGRRHPRQDHHRRR
jgi:UDP-N-acetylmuramate-alanine ligase